jgi:fatty acid desaturase
VSYYQDLAFSLRCRRVPEARVEEALREVRDLCEQSGQEPREQFGPASDYAEQFPEGSVRSPATRLAVVVLMVATAVLAFGTVRYLWAGTALRIGPVALIWVWLPVQVAVIVAAIVADHRLPAGFRVAGSAQRE